MDAKRKTQNANTLFVALEFVFCVGSFVLRLFCVCFVLRWVLNPHGAQKAFALAQCDQIGRNFAIWANFFLGKFAQLIGDFLGDILARNCCLKTSIFLTFCSFLSYYLQTVLSIKVPCRSDMALEVFTSKSVWVNRGPFREGMYVSVLIKLAFLIFCEDLCRRQHWTSKISNK